MPSFDGPIPGESLTTKPRGAAYERPPKVHDLESALAIHLERLHDPDRMESVVDLLENGVSIRQTVEGIARGAVAAGIHSIDLSLQVAPILHEFIKRTADDLGVEYDEGFDEGTDSADRRYKKAVASVRRKEMAEEAKPRRAPVEAPVEPVMGEGEATAGGAVATPPAGLMARGM